MTIASQNSIVVNKEIIQYPQNQIILNKGITFNDSNKESNCLDDSLIQQTIENDDINSDKNLDNDNERCNDGLVLKLSVKDGIISKIDSSPKKSTINNQLKRSESSDSKTSRHNSDDGMDDTMKNGTDSHRSKGDRSKSKEHRSHDRSRKSSSSSSHKLSTSSSKISSSSHKHSSSSSSSKSHKSSNSSSKSSSSSSSNGNRDKSKDKHSSSSSSSKSSSSSSRDKDKDKEKDKLKSKMSQADKDKDTLAKVLPQSLNKLAKIPKKCSTTSPSTTKDEKSDKDKTADSAAVAAKKKSISIEVRNKTADRPKTVKAYNAQFRSHGLAEEAPPPPSRKDLKKPLSTTPAPGTAIPSIPIKRSLSPSSTTKELEKKLKLNTSPTDRAEKPGAIKLIPPKPKRKYFLVQNLINSFLLY